MSVGMVRVYGVLRVIGMMSDGTVLNDRGGVWMMVGVLGHRCRGVSIHLRSKRIPIPIHHPGNRQLLGLDIVRMRV